MAADYKAMHNSFKRALEGDLTQRRLYSADRRGGSAGMRRAASALEMRFDMLRALFREDPFQNNTNGWTMRLDDSIMRCLMAQRAWLCVRTPVALAIVAAMMMCGCGGDDEKPQRTGDGGTAPPPGWLAAVGGEGTLAATFDDVSWSVRRIAERDLRSVACVGNELGWVAGAQGLALHTQDGGGNWTVLATGVSADFAAISFAVDPREEKLFGVVAGSGGALAVSRDGGRSFFSPPISTTSNLNDAALAAETRLALVVGDAGVVLRSTDGLESFSTILVDGAADLEGVALDAAGRLAVAVDSEGRIFASTDGGERFVLEQTAGVPLRGVALSHAGSWGLAVGDGGQAFLREPIGRWSKLATGSSEHLYAALVTHDEQRVYAAGANGTLLRSANLGATWARVAVATTATLYALEDLDPH